MHSCSENPPGATLAVHQLLVTLGKLVTGGDMIASEAKYHQGCLLALYSKANRDDTKAAAYQSQNCIKKTINKIRRKRFSIWRMKIFHLAMWHVALPALGSWHWIHEVAATAMWNVALGWYVTEFARWQHPGYWYSNSVCPSVCPSIRHLFTYCIEKA